MKKIRLALASDFSIALEQVVLTPTLTNLDISRKDLPDPPIAIGVTQRPQRNTFADRKKKSGRPSKAFGASDFSTPLEQVLLTPALKPIFQ